MSFQDLATSSVYEWVGVCLHACVCVQVCWGWAQERVTEREESKTVKVLSLITESTVEPLTELGNSHLAQHQLQTDGAAYVFAECLLVGLGKGDVMGGIQ